MDFEARIAATLIDHYAHVAATFSGQEVRLGDTLSDIAPHRAPQWTRQAYAQAQMIMDTLAKAAQKAEFEGDETKAAKPKWTAAIEGVLAGLKKWWKGKAGTVANVNTNGVAEDARRDHVESTSDTARPLYKRWVTMLDERVRPAHREMHGVAVPIGETFDVAGYKMNQPGDPQYGAPLGLLINCRCHLQYVQQGEDGRWNILGEGPSSPTRSPRKPGAPLGSNVPKTPTSSFTFVGNPSRGSVILGNGEIATFTAGPGGIVIRVNRKPIASAALIRNPDGTWRIGSMSIERDYRLVGVDTLIRNSVNATNRLIARTGPN